MKQITNTRAARAKKMNSVQGWHRNTETFVDLKSFLRSDRVLQPGRDYNGVLRRELPVEDNAFEDWHYTFLETIPPQGLPPQPASLRRCVHYHDTHPDGRPAPQLPPLPEAQRKLLARRVHRGSSRRAARRFGRPRRGVSLLTRFRMKVSVSVVSVNF